jgi:hypothetical protein
MDFPLVGFAINMPSKRRLQASIHEKKFKLRFAVVTEM